MQNIVENRRFFHRFPEVGYDLPVTVGRIVSEIRRIGLEMIENSADSCVVAILRSESPHKSDKVRCWRADCDALEICEALPSDCRSEHPGYMHACGHDVHMAVALGAAELLKKEQSRLPCDIVFLFQPNEEGKPGSALPTGAVAVRDSGILEQCRVSEIYALHCCPELNVGQIGISPLSAWAATSRILFEIRGRSSHAAFPHRGQDAILAASNLIALLYQNISRSRNRQYNEIFTVYRLYTDNTSCTVADKISAEATLRAENREEIDNIAKLIQNTCKGIEDIFGVDIRFSLFYGAPEVKNDPKLVAQAMSVLADCDFCRPLSVPMQMAGEDFSYYLSDRSGLYVMLGIASNKIQAMPLHSDFFTIDEDCLEVGARAAAKILMSPIL